MTGQYNSTRITRVASSVLDAMGLAPFEGAAPAIPVLQQLCSKAFDGKPADRVLLYNPDAVALWLYQKYTDLFNDAMLSSNVALPMLAVMPSVTPVCFASMYTGVMPEVHGIQAYVKPVLKIHTLFDELVAAGKKVAIVSTTNDSLSIIFLERPIDYFIYDTVDEINAKAHELIAADQHDVVLVYNANYDAQMHKTGPESPEAIANLKANVETYRGLVEAVEKHWKPKGHRTFYGFMPDHGCHEIDGGAGSHGLDMDVDMNIIHFYGCK